MKKDRKPEYGKKDASYRIVSRPNGEWAVQQYHEPIQRSNKRDPWRDLIGASRLGYEAACMRLANTQPN